MHRKSLYKTILMLGFGILMLGMVVSPCRSASKITLEAISAWPKNTFMVENFTRFIDNANAALAKQYPGELEIVYKGGPEIISFQEQVEAVRTGLIDMVFTATSYYTSIIPLGDGFSASYLKPWEEREKGVFDFMQKIHADKANAYFLARMGSGIPFQFYVNEKIQGIDDFKGMKIRGSPTLIPFLKKLGANPVMLPPGDIYTGLERGVVTGYVWPAAQIREWGWESVTKYVVEPPTPYQAIDVVLVNLDKWNKIPKNIQDVLIGAAKEDEHKTIERAEAYIPRENAELKKMGIEFIDLPAADAKKFEEMAVEALWEVIIQRDPENGPKFKEMLSK